MKDVDSSKRLGADNPFRRQKPADLKTRLQRLPLRKNLRGKQPYGAPQLDVPIRLNVNENTHPLPLEVSQAIGNEVNRAIAGINRYPDRDFTRLRRKLAAYLNGIPKLAAAVDMENIWAANGSNEVLQHIFQAFGGPGRNALTFVPTYSMYELIAAGTDTRYVTGERTAHYQLEAAAVKEAVDRYKPHILILCSPNNPVGDSLSADIIDEIYGYTAPYETIVVIDEAYAEFMHHPENSALQLVAGGDGRERSRLIVTRTMSKAFAAAGLRVGYLAAASEIVLALQLVRLPYHLSLMTQVAAETALEHANALMKDVEKIKGQRDRIIARLTEYGYEPYPSEANFVLFGGVADPAGLWRHLLNDGILIRDIKLPHCLRVTAGTEAETSAFLNSVARYENDGSAAASS